MRPSKSTAGPPSQSVESILARRTPDWCAFGAEIANGSSNFVPLGDRRCACHGLTGTRAAGQFELMQSATPSSWTAAFSGRARHGCGELPSLPSCTYSMRAGRRSPFWEAVLVSLKGGSAVGGPAMSPCLERILDRQDREWRPYRQNSPVWISPSLVTVLVSKL